MCGPGEATAFVAGWGPGVYDGVSITNDGRQIRTRDDVLAWGDAMAGDADEDDANQTPPA